MSQTYLESPSRPTAVAVPGRQIPTLLRSVAFYVLPPALALALAFLFWEVYVEVREIDVIIVPPPSAIWQRFLDDPAFFLGQGGWTLYEAFLGLLLGSGVAIILAIVMAHSSLAERTLFPIAILVKVTPIVAIAPILVIWFGLGSIMPKIVVAALLSFFPMLVNSVAGFRAVNSGALDFMRSLRASPWQIFSKLRVPSALPYLFAALRVTLPLALIGAVVAEWFTGDRGLGFVIFAANYDLDTPTLFAAVAVLAVMGVTLNIIVSLAERRLLFWHEAFRNGRR
jgi:ABC-type nitrate/sulfonate/bicarbonate transport system permease component